jgi:hypothetical protein
MSSQRLHIAGFLREGIRLVEMSCTQDFGSYGVGLMVDVPLILFSH